MRTGLVVALAFVASTGRAEAPAAGDAVSRARTLRLADDPEWFHLLHYETDLFGGTSSEVSRGDFFLSPRGGVDREAELVATLTAFFAPVRPGEEDGHALCRFPARRAWLNHKLRFLPSDQVVRCPELDAALERLGPTGVHLVYASTYIGNPASAFGHAFLHVTTREGDAAPEGSEERDIVNRGIEYLALTHTKNPLFYAFEGIVGMFPGRFEVPPYNELARRYTAEHGGRHRLVPLPIRIPASRPHTPIPLTSSSTPILRSLSAHWSPAIRTSSGPSSSTSSIPARAGTRSIFEPNNYSQVLQTFPIVLAAGSNNAPFTTIGGNNNTYPQGRKVTQWQINDNLDWIRGKQEYRFGINTRRVDISDYDLGEGSVPTAVYNDLAEFTYGAAYTESQTFPISFKERVAVGNLDLYAMDTYKPAPKATLIAGVRATWNTDPVNQQHLFARPAGSFLDFSHGVNQPLNQVIQTGVRTLFPSTPLLV